MNSTVPVNHFSTDMAVCSIVSVSELHLRFSRIHWMVFRILMHPCPAGQTGSMNCSELWNSNSDTRQPASLNPDSQTDVLCISVHQTDTDKFQQQPASSDILISLFCTDWQPLHTVDHLPEQNSDTRHYSVHGFLQSQLFRSYLPPDIVQRQHWHLTDSEAEKIILLWSADKKPMCVP